MFVFFMFKRFILDYHFNITLAQSNTVTQTICSKKVINSYNLITVMIIKGKN